MKKTKLERNCTNDEHSELPQHRLWQPTTAKWFAAVFGGSLAYAVVRYHLAGDVPWHHFPLQWGNIVLRGTYITLAEEMNE
jgi:hypothetical protein